MYLLFHIFTALTAGCILALLLKNKWAVFWCALGGLMPDFMDKVFGHFTFYEVIGTEYRMYFHSLLFAVLCLAAGIILLVRNRNRIGLFCASIGIIIHFLGDEVWLNTKTLFWPVLGNLISPEGLQLMLESGKLITLIISAAEAVFFIVFFYLYAGKMKPVQKLIYWISFALIEIFTQIISMLIFNTATSGAQQSNWNYFFEVMAQETSMFSEWVFGISAVILLLLVFLGWLKRDIHAVAVAAGTGLGCFICGVVLLICRLCGCMLDARYAFYHAAWAALALIVCGCIIMLLSKKVFGSGNYPESSGEE